MAARRCRCGYTTPDVWADECPLCLSPLALVGEATAAAQPLPRQRRRRPLVIIAIVVAVIVLPVAMTVVGITTGLAAPLFLGKPSNGDSTGRIRAGMSLRDAVRELEPESNADAEVSLYDLFEPGAAPSGRFTWGSGSRVLRVTFRDWRVWSVEEGTLPFPVNSLVRIDYDDRGRPRTAER